ncbi:nucleoside deaminase [Methanosarcina sp. Z-7115]|uniref:Nucleoside deaminase n=1 Tax=Methanosarcina baikalica TaxID=3073890 RepID=A0ABU2D1L6_9EURY|nr:nucleoside deaminase [Methanosarcina sp. Z-7115]MDR7665880.1 nucleoside deaminase [Methanosarcina sp. Z-7115]
MRFKYSIRDLGEGILKKIDSQSENIINLKNWLQEYDFFPEYPDDPYAWLTDVLALKSVNSGNYGVGSVLVSAGGEIAAMGHNLVYSPYFRSDLHAEMVTVNYFEKENPQITTLKEYALYTSLESCPMCLVRLISAGINKVFYVSPDPIGGMVNSISLLPPLWKDLSAPQAFTAARCSRELSNAATEIMLINANELLEILRKRRE